MIGRERSRAAAVIALVAVAIAAIAIASQLGTWTDEEYTLATTSRGVPYAFDRALGYELQAPLYFVLEAIWREANASLLWARLPSLACGVGLFFLLLRIGRRVAPAFDPLPFAAVASLNPFVVFATFEIRLYALALVLSAVMWLAFDAGFIDDSSPRARVTFVCSSIAAVYVQYFLGFALVGYACTVLIRRPRAFAPFALSCLPIVLAALPLAGWAYRQVGGYAAPQPTLSFLLRHAALHPWLDFVFPYDRNWDVVRGIRTSYDALVAIAVAALFWARPRFDRAALAWIASAVAIEATYLVLLAVLGLQLDDRHYVALFVPLAIATYAVVRSPVPIARSRVVAGTVLLAACLTTAVLVTRYRHLAQPGDWRRVAAYLEASAKPGDAIVVFAADAIPALARQYHGPLRLMPFPRAPDPNRYEADALVVHSQAEASAALAPLAAYAHVWFVSDVRCRSDEDSYGCANVEPAIARRFRVIASKRFYESRVEELRSLPMRSAGGTSLGRATSTSTARTPPMRMKNPTLTAKAST